MVRLDDFAVFVNSGGTDDGQVAVRQFGFQYISRTGISLSVVQQYMDFVNKQDCIVDIPQFLQDVFQAVLDFPLVGGSAIREALSSSNTRVSSKNEGTLWLTMSQASP